MCQYSSDDGKMNEWHLVHLGSRAVGGAALVITEATAVSPEGRITPHDAGIWSDEHVEMLLNITKFIKSQGAFAGIQLAHAGRKASMREPWKGEGLVAPADGGWVPVAPSANAFSESYPTPLEMDKAALEKVRRDFSSATDRALKAGFDVIEIHMAHGYLFHEFLSPLSNMRASMLEDNYGGSLENRMRFPLEIAALVRQKWPQNLPVFVRISATDWIEGGWSVQDSVTFCQKLKSLGIDLIDCSSGGNAPKAPIPIGPGYQVCLSETVRRECGILTGAVGMITSPEQAETILATGQADAVLLARELLRDPYWPIYAARKLGVEIKIPNQYLRSI